MPSYLESITLFQYSVFVHKDYTILGNVSVISFFFLFFKKSVSPQSFRWEHVLRMEYVLLHSLHICNKIEKLVDTVIRK